MAGQGSADNWHRGQIHIGRTLVLIALAGLCLVGVFAIRRSLHGSGSVGDRWNARSVTVANGVTYHYFAEGDPLLSPTQSDALILDIDLRAPNVLVSVAADHEVVNKGRLFADAHTVADWCEREKAVAGVNGGFFGATDRNLKQAEGLLVTNGKVRNAGRWVRAARGAHEPFLRSCLGFSRDGRPRIDWVVSNADNTILAYDRPTGNSPHRGWPVQSAVACGPRLIEHGADHITDHEERLVSPYPVPRTFAAFDMEGAGSSARPRHLVLGIAMQMTYQDAAAFLRRYFKGEHRTECAEAMCLDGGSSSQLVFKDPGPQSGARSPLVDVRPSGVTVPTAILVHSSYR